MEKVKLSAVVLTFNEEKKIEKCLKSLFWVDEILVVDSFSSDNTVPLAKRYTDKILQNSFTGFATQRNLGLEKASHEWILILDADEEVSPELAQEIMEIIKEPGEVDVYYILRNNFSFGRLLRHGGNSPDYSVRLFRKNRVRYSGKEIHEVPIVRGKVQRLKHPIKHFNYSSISGYLPKFNFFTDFEAKEMAKNEKGVSWLKIIFYPVLRFFWTYILKSGWRDGFAGFLMSIYGSFYMLTKYLKYKELRRSANWN